MWSIAEIDNTVEISNKCAKELLKIDPECRWNNRLDRLVMDGKLYFNPDDYEGMDFVYDEDVQKVLKKHKVKGDITFGSLDGDNFGSFWGYRFDGKGGMVELRGELIWKEKE